MLNDDTVIECWQTTDALHKQWDASGILRWKWKRIRKWQKAQRAIKEINESEKWRGAETVENTLGLQPLPSDRH